MSIDTEVGQAVRELRNALGLTQEQFAHRIETTSRTIARWESAGPPKGKALHQLQRIAREHGEPELAAKFAKALATEMDWSSEPAQPVWAGIVRELVRNERLCPRWPKLAAALLKELEGLIALAKTGTEIEGSLQSQPAKVAYLEGYAVEGRYQIEGSAEKVLNMLTDQKLREHPEKTREQIFVNVLVDHPELYEQYRKERANAESPIPRRTKKGPRP